MSHELAISHTEDGISRAVISGCNRSTGVLCEFDMSIGLRCEYRITVIDRSNRIVESIAVDQIVVLLLRLITLCRSVGSKTTT